MKRNRLLLGMAALLAAGGLWITRTSWREDAVQKLDDGAGAGTRGGGSGPGQMENRHAPPDPIRKFRDLTPEERVKRARQGPIGG